MDKTRLSLFYLAGYLLSGGFGLLLMPALAARLLLSNAAYPDVMLQSLGMFMLGLGIIVVQIIRLRIVPLYPTTIVVRLFFCACLLYFHQASGDPMFLVLTAIVALGLLLTGSSLWSERGHLRSSD